MKTVEQVILMATCAVMSTATISEAQAHRSTSAPRLAQATPGKPASKSASADAATAKASASKPASSTANTSALPKNGSATKPSTTAGSTSASAAVSASAASSKTTAAAAAPSSSAPRSNLAPAKPLDPAVEQSLNAGIALFNKGKYEEALVPLQKALELQSNNTGVRNWLGATYMQLKKFDQSAKIYEEVVKMDPDYAEGHNNLAYCYQQLSQFDKAEPEYREAVKLKPNFKEAHFNLAYVLIELKKSESAIKEFEEVLRLDPQFADAYFQIGKMYMQLKAYDQASEWYDKAIAKDKKNVAARTDKAVTCDGNGDKAGAREQLEKVLDINSQFYDANLELGAMALEDKDYGTAMPYLVKALEANPYHPAVHFNLGRYYYQLDQMKNSITQFQDCIKCDKEYPGAEEWLAKAIQKQKSY